MSSRPALWARYLPRDYLKADAAGLRRQAFRYARLGD